MKPLASGIPLSSSSAVIFIIEASCFEQLDRVVASALRETLSQKSSTGALVQKGANCSDFFRDGGYLKEPVSMTQEAG